MRSCIWPWADAMDSHGEIVVVNRASVSEVRLSASITGGL